VLESGHGSVVGIGDRIERLARLHLMMDYAGGRCRLLSRRVVGDRRPG
jgi:hypothetical protein